MKRAGPVAVMLMLSVFLLSTYAASLPYAPESVGSSPGDIIDIICSDPYPTLGEPVLLFIVLSGNPQGERFTETLTIVDDFEGITIPSTGVQWAAGQVCIAQRNVTIGRASTYTTIVPWYPSIVGNHTFHCIIDNRSETTIKISVGFDTQDIIVPSLGCPRIIQKDTANELTLLISEEHDSAEEHAEVLYASLQSTTDGTIYPLTSPTDQFITWIAVGEHTRQDELFISYDVAMLPQGLYDLSVTTRNSTYAWEHAVCILNQTPEAFSFVHLTDTHIGKSYNLAAEKRKLTQIISHLNEYVKPDFIVITGDLVDWVNYLAPTTFHETFKDIIVSSMAPVFTLPGNHERYEHRLLFFYNPYTDLSAYHRTLNPVNDYSFDYGSIHFTCLDSGYDFSRWEIKPRIWNPTPESSGLTNTQMYLLEYFLGDPTKNQAILMHHPAVNDRDDRGLFALHNSLPSGNDECIAHNRGAFIQYCRDKNVSLMLCGHTHANKVLSWRGTEPENLSDWPLFVQTDSSTLNGAQSGGRIINVHNTVIEIHEYAPFN